ncbi:hypothetical protein [Sulfuriflexus mobilis]|uniref:hypothetical protein n=1 Tax=Sulfuriflexus mobilis TaxID=1811807 RepID=UPI0018D51D52|nr:hypothetical protein [Sulfuriflexus mobilis]
MTDLENMTMDANGLYRDQSYTDRKAGTIRVLSPVTVTGEADAGRPTLFLGHAQMMTAAGPMPLSFEIAAADLAEAVENYAAAARQAVEQAIEEIKEMQRQASSQIVVPGGGGVPGGGIQMP